MLAKLVEARDTDAGRHLHRIQHFSRALALRLGLAERDAQEIAYASMMHDVGKANVPDVVLKKPGPLSTDDWKTMKLHTVWGEALLAEHQDFDLARQVARWHHEHWDGRGYPDGLIGTQIPRPARIVSVADVFDALISERPYKDAWTENAAIEEVKRLSGTQLDPEVVEAFVDLYERGVIARITQQLFGEDDFAALDKAA
jgi:putative two-component system response regulator